ncbi:MAG TPA: gluconolactonase [Pirellulaceae bacterium]|jgi:hypothetical protein|nr:gluconolactonase [Pirellulaceae bacterium]
MLRVAALSLACLCSFALVGLTARAADDDKTVTLADGKVTLVAPANWEKKEPKTNIVEYEFLAPAEEGDKNGARVTVMGAGGGVKANVDRWIGQFSQPDGSETSEKTFQDKQTVGDAEVIVVDISGTYKDQPGGPFAPGPVVQRENYRMLAGIVSTKNNGDYFIKMYGPAKTVEAQAEAFKKMMKDVKVK